MRTFFTVIGLPTSMLVLALSNIPYFEYSILQSRGYDRPLLRRSPMENLPSSSRSSSRHSSKSSSKKNSPESAHFGGFLPGKETAPLPTKQDTPSPASRNTNALGVVQAAHPAQGYMMSGMHGEWETKPKPNIPSMAKIKHPNLVCVGGSCSGPKGVLATDVVGRRVTTRIDSRAGGTVDMADHEDMNAQPQWRSYGTGKHLTVTTTAKENTLARHHVRLEGAGRVEAIGSMNYGARTDSASQPSR